MFYWKQNAQDFEVSRNCVQMTAGHGTNLFNGVSGMFKCGDFPFYCVDWTGDFRVRCQIHPEFGSLYDLGCIVVWENEDKWMKLAYENADTGQPSIVSVVTRDRSDDCNGESARENVWLQICRKGAMFSMHWSEDGETWRLVRIFHLEMSNQVQVGISAQCPNGRCCKVTFSDLQMVENPYEDIRNLR